MIKCWNTKESDVAELGVLFEDNDIKRLTMLLTGIKNKVNAMEKPDTRFHCNLIIGMIEDFERKIKPFLPEDKPELLLRAQSSDPTHVADRLNLVIDFLNEKFKNDRQS